MTQKLIAILLCFFFTGVCCNSNNWIVVTTIQYPTDQLLKLSQIEGWHLLVVGDKKTPCDWHLDNCTYLSPEKQLSLGYELTNLLPWNHYSRKNIGYLYAIENGAEVIYDTDDDNEPISELKPTFLSKSSYFLPKLQSNTLCVNVYGYFGQEHVWPRGYPLQEILADSEIIIGPATECNIGIENSVVNGNPDVDAIFRLTKNDFTFFTDKTSCFLPKNVFCPFNSQNTFFYKKAFFTLYLPCSVNMRATDIWRGYIAQRLLWETGQFLAFSKPSAYQVRNQHNLLKDFEDEIQVYLKSYTLVQKLFFWVNPYPDNPLISMKTLYDFLIDENFFEKNEQSKVIAWKNDLNRIMNKNCLDKGNYFNF